MLRLATAIVLGTTLFGLPNLATAGYLPESTRLTENAEKADAILLCRITTVVADEATTRPKHATTDLREIMRWTAIQPASTYKLEILRAIKGSVRGDLQIHLPLVSTRFYYNKADFKVQPGVHCLLMLSSAAPNSWLPVDDTIPLIPLGEKVDVESSVLGLMLASLGDPASRANTFLLRNTKNDEVVKELRKYVDDPDDRVRASAVLLHGLQPGHIRDPSDRRS